MVMKRVYFLMAFSLLLHCSEVSAKGYNFDVLSVEAVIEESRSAGSMNLSRAAIEFYNRGVHKESNEKAIDYEKVEKCLDKYLRCLDYIDVLYTGALLDSAIRPHELTNSGSTCVKNIYIV